MNRTQINYHNALSRYNKAHNVFQSRIAEFYPLMESDETLEQYVEQEIRIAAELNIDELQANLIAAENELLIWGQSFLKNSPAYTADIDNVFAEAKRNIVIRKDVLGTCVRIDARS